MSDKHLFYDIPKFKIKKKNLITSPKFLIQLNNLYCGYSLLSVYAKCLKSKT